MIALDASALVAIALDEPEAAAFAHSIASADHALIGLPTVLEARMVLIGRLGEARAASVLELFLAPHVRRVGFDEVHFAQAVDAFCRFGKGRHMAGLNFGDCMAYAVAKVAACPLLYKGNDFARTDIRSAL